jgi:hypothetical protein
MAYACVYLASPNEIATICPEAASPLVTYSGNYDVGEVGQQILKDEFGNALEDFYKLGLSDVISLR